MALDSFQIQLLQEGKEYRDALGEHDADLDAMLERALAQTRITIATPLGDTHNVPMQDRRPGHSNYGGQATGASEAQAKFIRSLCEERGLDADTVLAGIKTKARASAEIDRLKKLPRTATVRPATERQLEFLQDLLTTRVHEYTVGDTVSFDDASAMIAALLDAPKAAKAAHGIRHGRYAYQPEGAQAQFYRVAQDGRIYIQAGPAEHPYRGTLNTALEAIKADPKTHAALYGHLIGVCGRCSLPLTDETSRAQGLGPICVNKSDW